MTFKSLSQTLWHVTKISLKLCTNSLVIYGALLKHANTFRGKWVSSRDSLWSLINCHLKVNIVRFRRLFLECASAILNKYK